MKLNAKLRKAKNHSIKIFPTLKFINILDFYYNII